MTPSTETNATGKLAMGLARPLIGACLVGTLGVVGVAWAVSSEMVSAAGLAGTAVLAGTGAGIAAVGIAGGTRIEPGFLVLGASILRATVAVLVGLEGARAAAVPERAFWISFLVVMALVMAAEVVASRRLLMSAPGGVGHP